ncbi:FAD-dependent oxidoreductase [Mangrovimicrobium sediminis]|uniref:FAD-dependent oxidoreductase n=1 Tax=Mangrovimicrobium sediminis TaxID=2562682 RepID=A0A4Z0M7B0_9GAMM|nr:FAD-dependent oxidoreductase [Haliea sp. SAOS-164]TGD75298.1 FAD-dependent oxidoreductase [Haliea sp. SAOS-164]
MHEDLRQCLWFDTLAEQGNARTALEQDITADVAIVGAGYTGLWTAYHLLQLQPDLSVVILEAEHVGFGASGRNGGWLMGAIEGLDSYLAPCDPHTRALALGEVHAIPERAGAVLEREGIDCDFAHGGAVYAAARYPQQRALARAHLDSLRGAGHSEQDYRWLEADELAGRVRIAGASGAIYTPHVAAIQPAKLAAGLATACERLGARIFEGSRVIASGSQGLRTSSGSVRAPVVISAVEGYGAGGWPQGMYVLPFQSGMVATQPLPAAVWEEMGFTGRPVLSDYSRLSTYMQRTADDRLVFGARGNYRFGGAPISRFDANDPAFEMRRELARTFFPVLREVSFTHAWGGTLGISRRFAPHVVYDAASGTGTAGGYTGEGVGASFLFGQTLAELILSRDSLRTRLPWVLHGPAASTLRRWEPEPLRWLGFKAAWSIYGWEEAVLSGGRAGRWHQHLASLSARLVERILTP